MTATLISVYFRPLLSCRRLFHRRASFKHRICNSLLLCCCLRWCCHSGGEYISGGAGRKSSQWLYDAAAGNQLQRRHTLVQCPYGNGTTLTDVYRGGADKLCSLPTHVATFQQDTDQHRTGGNDGRLLQAQLVASADCVYCRYGSLDARRPIATADDDVCRQNSDANLSTVSMQHSSLTT